MTKRGSTAQARLAESLIRATGLPQLIVEDQKSYIETAITLANDRSRLDAHRKALDDALPHAPLFDAARMVKQFEIIYDHVIAQHQDGRPLDHFDVDLP